jgi:hypothetical protein
MSETIPSKPEKQPIDTEVDPDFYKRLCKVVKAGTFRSINFSLWHKGCDIEIDATCRWPDLKSKLDEWYFSVMDSLDLHTEAEVRPDYTDGQLTFRVSTIYDGTRDGMSEVQDAWQEAELQQLVYGCLPKKLRDKTEPEDLSISLEASYDNLGKSEMSGFSISLRDGESTADFTAGISKKSLEAIKKYVIGFCTDQDSTAEDVSISIEDSQVDLFSSYIFGEEKFLLVPKP